MLGLAVAAMVGLVPILWANAGGPPPPQTMDERVHEVASGLRCPVCRNLSVGDSPSQLAEEMRASIRQMLTEGKSPEEVRRFFVARYGDWILLSPKSNGVGLLPWVAPLAALILGALLVARVVNRRNLETGVSVTEAERDRIRRELQLVQEPD